MILQYTYQLITDPENMQRFFDLLPELNTHEAYMIILQIRKKYCSDVKSDDILKRKLVYKKERLIREIKKMEIPYGSYTLNGNPIPQEAFAVYIKITPRNTHIFDSALDFLNRFKKNEFKTLNPSNALLTHLQSSASKRKYAIYDFDIKGLDNYSYDDLINSLYDIVGKSIFHVVETRGGYHLMLDLHNLDKSKVRYMFKSLDTHPHKDNEAGSDIHTPVVGGYQGGFTPILKSYNTES